MGPAAASVSRFHSRTVLSALLVASTGCFGLATTLNTSSPWPPAFLTCFPSPFGFQVRSCLSAPTENPALPSAFTATP